MKTMKTIEQIENFFKKDFSTDELKDIIDNLQDKEKFFNEREFVNYQPNDYFVHNNFDVVALSLIEKETSNLFLNNDYTSKNQNELVLQDKDTVIKKMSYDVFQNKFKNLYEYEDTINTLVLGKNFFLEQKSLDNLIEEVDKEAYYTNVNENGISTDDYTLIRKFNTERTETIDSLINERLFNKIVENKSLLNINNFYNSYAQDYSNIEYPNFLKENITVNNFQKSLQEIQNLNNKKEFFLPETIQKTSSFLINNMDKKEAEKLNALFVKNKCTDEKSLTNYLTKLVKGEKTLIKEKNNTIKLDNLRGY